MDITLNPTQRKLVDTVRKLTQEQFKPNAQRYQDGTFPVDNMKSLAQHGILGMAVPKEYGGLGLPVFDTALVLEEIAKGCYVTAMAVLGEVGTQTRVIATFAPESIRRRILPGVCSGEHFLSICMTEPHAGTDVANYKTNTQIKNGRAILNGKKSLISRATEASMFVVFSRVNNVPGIKGIGCVLVDRNTQGMRITDSRHTMGGEYLHEIEFDHCEVPEENVILTDRSFAKLINAFNTQRCLNPSISLGLAEGALDASLQFARDREIKGAPLSTYQGMRWKLAQMYTDIEVARSVLYRACQSADPFPDPLLAAIAKTTCNDMSMRVTNEAIQIHGGYGFTDESAVSRLFRGARYGSLGGGTTEALLELISKHAIDGITKPAPHTRAVAG